MYLTLCKTCNGSKYLPLTIRNQWGHMRLIQAVCPRCTGSGRMDGETTKGISPDELRAITRLEWAMVMAHA